MKKLLIQKNQQDVVGILCIALEMENYETLGVLGMTLTSAR
jgi:predicted transcriptional regulator YheO